VNQLHLKLACIQASGTWMKFGRIQPSCPQQKILPNAMEVECS